MQEGVPIAGSGVADSGSPISQLALVTNAELGTDVRIGPFSVIGREGDEPAIIGDRTIIEDHVLVEPGTVIGADCLIEDHCRIGRGSVVASGSRVSSGILRTQHTAARHQAPDQTTQGIPSTEAVSDRALVAGNVVLGRGVQVGPFAIVGWVNEEPVKVGSGTRILPFALIEPGAVIGENCLIDAYCRIAADAVIGAGTQILYGAAVYEGAKIGIDCIIGGNVADRTVIEDYVTHFGEIAHDYRRPGDKADWDLVQAKSPRIGARSVIGQYAVIVGGITIGPGSVVAAGEVVRVDLPPASFFQSRKMRPLSDLRGLVKARSDRVEP